MISLQDAKNRFSALVEAALAGQPQAVSRRGRPAVVILSVADYDRLVDAAGRGRGRFVDHLSAFPDRPGEAPDDIAGDRPRAAPREVAF